MFERYTETARRIIFFARYEASRAASGSIEPEHLLLGILRETGNAGRVPQGSDREAIRREVMGTETPVETVTTHVDLPLAHSLKRILANAAEDASGLLHGHIDADHLLLGLLRDPESKPAGILARYGVTRESVRKALSERGPSVGPPSPALGFGSGSSRSARRWDDDALVIETHHVFEGHPIALEERIRLSEDGKTLLYSQVIRGPKQEYTQSFDFDVS